MTKDERKERNGMKESGEKNVLEVAHEEFYFCGRGIKPANCVIIGFKMHFCHFLAINRLRASSHYQRTMVEVAAVHYSERIT